MQVDSLSPAGPAQPVPETLFAQEGSRLQLHFLSSQLGLVVRTFHGASCTCGSRHLTVLTQEVLTEKVVCYWWGGGPARMCWARGSSLPGSETRGSDFYTKGLWGSAEHGGSGRTVPAPVPAAPHWSMAQSQPPPGAGSAQFWVGQFCRDQGRAPRVPREGGQPGGAGAATAEPVSHPTSPGSLRRASSTSSSAALCPTHQWGSPTSCCSARASADR